MAAEKDLSEYTLQKKLNFVSLDAKEAWGTLTTQEKMYCYYISKACWAGYLAVPEQVSPEAPHLMNLFNDIYKNNTINEVFVFCSSKGVTKEEYQQFLNYVGTFFANGGNYKGFGDTKILPNLSKEKLTTILNSVKESKKVKDINKLIDGIYSSNSNELSLGIHPKGISNYFVGETMLKGEIKLVNDYLVHKEVSPYNTRVMKRNGIYHILVASAEKKVSDVEEYEGKKYQFVFGDHSDAMKKVAHYLNLAKDYVEKNSYRYKMLEQYVVHFKYGNMKNHKQSQREWVKDINPPVETNIGFIESYRDPSGVRGEFEGFSAVVNKKTSKKFAAIVDAAPELLKRLPWDAAFEKDKFLRPDFTSLEIINFAGSGIPAGINIPNYDDIRQSFGFKNVSLENVLKAGSKTDDKVEFLEDQYQKIYKEYCDLAFEVQVAGHELLGHGSGKLFMETSKDIFNFKDVMNPLTNTLVDKYYKVGETYDSVFGRMGSSYEECRAECVGMLVSLYPEALDIFGVETKDHETVSYVSWLNMLRGGFGSLLSYSVEKKYWLQAHSRARFVINKVLLEVDGLVKIDMNDDKTDFVLKLDRDLYASKGRTAIESFLNKLQVYKATANSEEAKKMYNTYSEVTDEDLELRKIIFSKRKPRKSIVQPTLVKIKDSIKMMEYEGTAGGLIQSYIDKLID